MCGYCVAAKNLLTQRGAAYEEVRVDRDAARRAEMRERSQRTSVPQIFIGDRHIGGYDDLARLDRAGELQALLGADDAGPSG